MNAIAALTLCLFAAPHNPYDRDLPAPPFNGCGLPTVIDPECYAQALADYEKAVSSAQATAKADYESAAAWERTCELSVGLDLDACITWCGGVFICQEACQTTFREDIALCASYFAAESALIASTYAASVGSAVTTFISTTSACCYDPATLPPGTAYPVPFGCTIPTFPDYYCPDPSTGYATCISLCGLAHWDAINAVCISVEAASSTAFDQLVWDLQYAYDSWQADYASCAGDLDCEHWVTGWYHSAAKDAIEKFWDAYPPIAESARAGLAAALADFMACGDACCN